MKPLFWRIAVLFFVFSILAVTMTSCASPDSSPATGGNFFGGLFAPMSFPSAIIRPWYDPEAINWAENWDATWGQGSTGYRAGMVVGIIIYVYLIGSILSAVLGASSKTEQKK